MSTFLRVSSSHCLEVAQNWIFNHLRPAGATICAPTSANMFGHNSAADWAGELFKPSGHEEGLVDSIKKTGSFRFQLLCGWRHNWDRFKVIGWSHRALGPKIKRQSSLLKKMKTRRKCASSELLIGYLAFMVSMFSSKT